MKKIILIALLFAVNITVNAQRKKIALVSIGINKKINTENLSRGNTKFEQNINEIALNSIVDFLPFVTSQKDSFFGEYAEILPFDLVEENIVINNQEYIDFKRLDDMVHLEEMAVPAGYKFAREGVGAKKNEEGLAKIFGKDYDGVLFVYNEFMFRGGVSLGGYGTTYVACESKFALYNKEGEKIFSFVEIENCKDTIAKAEGYPFISDVDKLYKYMKCAFENVTVDMKKRLQKQSEKILKKLNK